MCKSFYYSIGRRKTSIAKVYCKKGSGIINKIDKDNKSKKPFLPEIIAVIKQPFLLVNLIDQYDLDIYVKGGGIVSQTEAISLAISRVVLQLLKSSFVSDFDYINLKSILKKKHLLSRDSRIKERRKYGLKKARKAPQYSKR